MAIQHRRGIYDQFDPTRLVAGEWAVVLSDDPSAADGRAAYVCFGTGLVKRVATYEDMQDWFASLKDQTVEDMVLNAMSEIREEYGLIKDETLDAEAARVLAEGLRATAENARAVAETAREDAETARELAETERETLATDLEQKRSSGYFNGATFTPNVDENGVLSWTNDKGKPNPVSVSIKGEKGNDGVVTNLDAGMFAFEVVGTDLYLYYNESGDVPDFSINDNGDLIVTIEGA